LSVQVGKGDDSRDNGRGSRSSWWWNSGHGGRQRLERRRVIDTIEEVKRKRKIDREASEIFLCRAFYRGVSAVNLPVSSVGCEVFAWKAVDLS